MTGPSDLVRVLVVDPDRRVRQSLAGLIRVSDGLECCGVAADPAAALEILERDPADVLLIDPRPPDADTGLALLHELHQRWPTIAIVAMGDSGTDPELPVLGDEVCTFVSRAAQPELLVETLRACGRATRDGASLERTDGATPEADA